MMSSKPFFHLFKNEENYYVYDVNRNSVLKLEKHIFEYLNLYLNNETHLSGGENDAGAFIEAMKGKGYFSSKRLKEIIHPENEFLEYYLNSKISMLSLQVTQQCNLRCEYCIYSGKYKNRVHSDRAMNFETAKAAIDFLVQHSRDTQEVYIGFYGGEPLIEFILIKNCIEYAEKTFEGKDIRFNITSNATLLNEEIISYLYEHDVNLLLSIDGPEHIQNSARKFISGEGTFHTIIDKLKMIRENYPEYRKNISFNAVIHCNSDLHAIDDFFTSCEEVKDIELSVQFVKGSCEDSNIYETPKFYEDFNNEVFISYLSLAGKIESRFVSKLVKQNTIDLMKFAGKLKPMKCLPEKGHPSGTCIPGVQRVFIDIHGNFYPCEKVKETSSMVIGNIYDGFDINKVRELLNIGKMNEEKCKDCWAFIFCNLCALTADELKDGFCEDIRNNTELMLKDYCTLKELGVRLDDSDRQKGVIR